MENDEIARLTAALRAVRAELDALPPGTQFLSRSSLPGSQPNPQALRYRKAVRDAAVALERSRTSFNSEELNALRRALESLLMEVPR